MTDKEPMPNRAISKDELESLNTTIADQDHERLYQSMSGGERVVYRALFDPITLANKDLDSNPLVATAGDPNSIMMDAANYETTTSNYMMSKVDSARERVTNTDESELTLIDTALLAVQDEIVVQHSRQCYRNNESIKRLKTLFLHDPSLFDLSISDIIYRVRSGEATSEERIVLLARHPEMDSIEDMKFTCPLDIKSYKKMMRTYLESLIELQHKSNIEYSPIPQHEQKIEIKDTSSTADANIAVIKVVIARIHVDGVMIELVERRSHYVFDSKPQLRGIADNIAKGNNGSVYNTQPIAVSAYFRIAKDASQEVS